MEGKGCLAFSCRNSQKIALAGLRTDFLGLEILSTKKRCLTTRPSWNTVLNGVRRWSIYSWRASFDTGSCIAWNRMGHKEEFYMRPTRLAWITYELKLHRHLLFWLSVVLTHTFKGLFVKSVLRSLYDSTHRFFCTAKFVFILVLELSRTWVESKNLTLSISAVSERNGSWSLHVYTYVQ